MGDSSARSPEPRATIKAVSTPAVRHPIFARFFDRLSQLMEREAGEHRAKLLANLSGRVVEVGAGNGINFPHYPPGVQEVVAIEPEPYLRAKAERAARDSDVRVTVRDGVADALPLESGTFDAAVACLVLCSVPDLGPALAELRRVLKPGGELRFMEHVRADSPTKARVQRWSDDSGLWPLLAGGCHCARDTVAAIRGAGFQVEQEEDFLLGPSWAITNPHVRGMARVARED